MCLDIFLIASSKQNSNYLWAILIVCIIIIVCIPNDWLHLLLVGVFFPAALDRSHLSGETDKTQLFALFSLIAMQCLLTSIKMSPRALARLTRKDSFARCFECLHQYKEDQSVHIGHFFSMDAASMACNEPVPIAMHSLSFHSVQYCFLLVAK